MEYKDSHRTKVGKSSVKRFRAEPHVLAPPQSLLSPLALSETNLAPIAQQSDYLVQLDGIRCLAVLLVLYDHWMIGHNAVPLGPLGVVMFFVLSGFLISRILFTSRQQSVAEGKGLGKYLSTFYIRRSLRIFPAYYACLLILFLANVPPVREKFWWCALYATNLHMVLRLEWLGTIDHFWSLAVEEQFYLFFPLLLYFLPLRRAPLAFVAMIIASVGLRYWLFGHQYPWMVAYVSTPTCLDAFGIGALMGYLWLFRSSLFARIFGDTVLLVTSIGLFAAIMVYSRMFQDYHNIVSEVFERFFAALMSAFLIGRAVLGFGQPVKWALENPVIVYLGRISYGLYLFHNLVFNYYHTPSSHPTLRIWNKAVSLLPTLETLPVVKFLYLLGLTIVVAAFSWHLLEQPINKLKSKFSY